MNWSGRVLALCLSIACLQPTASATEQTDSDVMGRSLDGLVQLAAGKGNGKHKGPKLKHFRAFATRYDKLTRNFTSTVFIACTLVWLKL